MTYVFLIFSIIITLMVLFAFMTIWSRRDTVARSLSILLLVVSIPLLGIASMETLGWHKPIAAAWRLSGEWLVLGSKMVVDEAIYIYVDVGGGEPRAIVLPWNDRVAQQLQDAMRDSRKRGQEGAILEYEWDWLERGEPNFWALPEPPLPIPKGESPEPEILERGA